MFNADQVKEFGKLFEEKMIEYRRHFHQNAELSFQEFETSKFIREKLSQWDIPCKEGIRGNSTIGIIDSGKPGPFVGFRADIDALPIEETNGLPFASVNKGVMHACGHDAHTAILLTLAEVFAKNRELIEGKVGFIFQQGEEKLPGGAKMILEDGGLDDMDCVYGLHIRSNLDVGQFESAAGVRSSAIHMFECEIEGKGGHTGFPHLAKDPVTLAAAVIQEFNQICAQCINPRDTATIAVGYLNTDNKGTHNVFSKSVTFGGTIRSLNNELVNELPKIMEKRLISLCESRGCKGTYKLIEGHPAVINLGEHYAYVAEAGKELGYENVHTDDILGSEDFSRMLLQKPGAYFTIGVRNPEKPETAGARHTPNLMLDEGGMRVGLELMLGAYLKTLDSMKK